MKPVVALAPLLLLLFVATTQAQAVHPFPESDFTAQETALMEEIETLIVEINRLSRLSPGDAGYVNPATGVTLYQSQFETPTGDPTDRRFVNMVGRDVTGVVALLRVGTNLFYAYNIRPVDESGKQCVIKFRDDFWALSPGVERDSRIAHELYHCFVLEHGRRFSLPLDLWFFEGAPELVGDHFGDVGIAPPFNLNRETLSPIGRDYGTIYMSSKNGLFRRDYDGAGYFHHLSEATSIGDVLARFQDLFAYKANPSNQGETESETLFQLTLPEGDEDMVAGTWATGLWMAREPLEDGPDEWDYDYFDYQVPTYPTREVDYVTDRGTVMHEIDLLPAEPEIVELTVQPGQYYRLMVENARARSISRNEDGLVEEYNYDEEDEPFVFCVGPDCECPMGARAYEFEILELGEEEEPNVVIAAAATQAGEGSDQIIYGKLTIERVTPPPCCTGGLGPRRDFPDVTGAWQFRPARVQEWADRLRDRRVEVIEEDPDTTCTEASVNNGSTVNITSQGSFRAEFGAVVEFECEDTGLEPSTRTFTYGWRGHYSGCITLQDADGFRVGYPEMANDFTRMGVETSQDFHVQIYNDGLDPGEEPVSMSPYQPSATANAFWYNVTSYLNYDQMTVRESPREVITDTVDDCVITGAGANCTSGVPRILGEYHFFTPDMVESPFDVFGGESATGLFIPVPYYFQEFAGGPVEYPQLVR